jgi:hypothetical protein
MEAGAFGDLEDELLGVNGAGGGGGLLLKAKEPGFVVGDGDEAIERARQGRGGLTEHGADGIAPLCEIELRRLMGRNGLSGGKGADLVSHAARRDPGWLVEFGAWGDGEEELGRGLVRGGDGDSRRFGGLVLGDSHREAKRKGEDK